MYVLKVWNLIFSRACLFVACCRQFRHCFYYWLHTHSHSHLVLTLILHVALIYYSHSHFTLEYAGTSYLPFRLYLQRVKCGQASNKLTKRSKVKVYIIVSLPSPEFLPHARFSLKTPFFPTEITFKVNNTRMKWRKHKNQMNYQTFSISP